ncbi:hypothetical protein ACSBR2_011096 [Camellia fascicularis]
METWPYVDSPYQRYVRNNSHCHLHQHSNMMKIQIGRADLTGKCCCDGVWMRLCIGMVMGYLMFVTRNPD